MRTSSLLGLIAAVAICLTATPTAALAGRFLPIPNIDAPDVQELGGWAVSEHNRRENAALKFNRVVGGQYQIVFGVMKYRLIIQASNPDGRYYSASLAQQWSKNNGSRRAFFSLSPVG